MLHFLARFFKIRNNKVEDCSICLINSKNDLVTNTCENRHIFHLKCLKEWVEYNKNNVATCPLCRSPLNFDS